MRQEYANLLEDIIKIADDGNKSSDMDAQNHCLRVSVDGTFYSLLRLVPPDLAKLITVYHVSGWRAAERFYGIKEKQ